MGRGKRRHRLIVAIVVTFTLVGAAGGYLRRSNPPPPTATRPRAPRQAVVPDAREIEPLLQMDRIWNGNKSAEEKKK